MYQGRVVADNILGRERAASYEGIPRVVFADPEIAAVGLTAAQARARGISSAAAEISLADSVDRPRTYERDPRGTLGLLADRDRGVLVGAWAVAPLASEWIHQAALAIRARIPIDTPLDQVAQYPTYSEAYLAALERLGLQRRLWCWASGPRRARPGQPARTPGAQRDRGVPSAIHQPSQHGPALGRRLPRSPIPRTPRRPTRRSAEQPVDPAGVNGAEAVQARRLPGRRVRGGRGFLAAHPRTRRPYPPPLAPGADEPHATSAP